METMKCVYLRTPQMHYKLYYNDMRLICFVKKGLTTWSANIYLLVVFFSLEPQVKLFTKHALGQKLSCSPAIQN